MSKPDGQERQPPYHEAGALIGVEIDPMKLYRDERHRCCGCYETPAEEWKHCPECGKPVWAISKVAIPELDRSDPGRVLLAGMNVLIIAPPTTPGLELTPLGREAIRFGMRLFVGEYIARTDMGNPARMAELRDLVDMKARMRTTLEPLGLWNEAKFGLWSILNKVG